MTRIHIPIHLRWGDLDAYNHVNNTSMLKLLEEARVRAFWRPNDGEEQLPTAVLDTGAESGTLTLIARQEIEYLRPVPYGRDPLDVQLWFGRIGSSSVDVCYEVLSSRSDGERGEQVRYARSTAVIVLVDEASGRPRRMPEDVRAAWEPFQDEPIAYTRRR